MFKKTVDGVGRFLKGIHDRLKKKPVEELLDTETTTVPYNEEKPIEKPDDGLMHVSREGLIEIASHEGICLSKYKDSVGVWTIGIGATRTEIPDIAKWPMDKTITVQEAFDLMARGMYKYENAIRKALKRDIPQYAFDALVSWAYNVGGGWAKRATVIKLINKGVPLSDRRIYNALMMYKKPPEIVGRRRKEAKLLTTGKYSNKGKVLLFPVSRSGRPIYRKGKQIDVTKYI